MVICKPPIRPKNRHLQSFLASARLRLRRLKEGNPVIEKQQEVMLDTPDARLQGFYTPGNTDQLSILLHGWEGSAESTYIQLLANTLHEQGHAIFRLNFRDHGATHHLNKDLFHSCRLQEVVDAIAAAQRQHPYQHNNLIGFSLGGNFALRVASKADSANIRLQRVFSVSPPINPKNSMIAISASSIYSRYFLNKWKRSLQIKADLYPQLFTNTAWQPENSLESLTRMLILQLTEYDTTDDYFAGYSITPEIISTISTPTHIITAWDDPVIPFDDFNSIDRLSQVQIKASPHGGHCGFIQGWSMRSWVEDYIIEETQHANIGRTESIAEIG
ncbi:YheT family hydrolase [Marinicella sp. W31]|uniref:YheT family hydrolase n=1 Tax=Marinicella sp. W31 TaxID=3023713 RepID=UPI0037569C3E